MANYQDRQIHEECGVFGVFGVEKAASLTSTAARKGAAS